MLPNSSTLASDHSYFQPSTPSSTCTGYQSANASNSSCAHWLAIASASAVLPGWHVYPCVGDVRSHSSAFYHSLWPRRSADSPGPLWASWFRRVGSSDLEQSTAWSSGIGTRLYPLPVSSTNSRLNCSSGRIAWDHSTFVIVYYKRGQKLTLTHCIVLYCILIWRQTEIKPACLSL